MLKETLRIYPTAPGTSRELRQDIVVDGIHVPAGAIGIVSLLPLSLFAPVKEELCVLALYTQKEQY